MKLVEALMCAISWGFQSLLTPSAHWREVIWYALESQDLNRRAHYFSSQWIPAGRLTPVWDISSYVFPLFLGGMTAGLRGKKGKIIIMLLQPLLYLSSSVSFYTAHSAAAHSGNGLTDADLAVASESLPSLLGAKERGFIGQDPIVKDTGFCSVT